MSVAKKFLLGAIGLVVTVLLGLLIFSISSKGQTSMNASTAQFDEMIGQYSNTKLFMYDNSTASGSEIISLINELNSTSGYDIVVINGANQKEGAEVKSVTYSYSGSTLSSNKEKMTKKTESSHYINPSASFKSTITEDDNGVIKQVKFIQQGVK